MPPRGRRLMLIAFMRLLVILSPLAPALCFPLAARAATPSASARTTLDAALSDQAPPVTGSFGDLASPIWQKSLHISSFSNFTTHQPVTDSTDAYLVFGPQAVYCAFVSQQETPITATQKENGVGLGLDDYVSLMFDTSGNGTNQYFFETSPRGVRYQAASESNRYDPPWSAKAAIHDRTWLGEIVVPYRFLRGVSSSWRINVVRYVAKTQVLYTYAFDTKMTSPYDATFWPMLRNPPRLEAAKRSPTAEIYGLADIGRDRHIFEGAAGQFSSNTIRNYGADLKIPITTGINLDATLNPDFSNVESDQQTISPQEFAYQYAEYRPFFTQGANMLPSSEVFYSPSIGIFDHGEKIEGMLGRFGIGVLDVGTFGSSNQAYNLAYNSSDQELSLSIAAATSHRLTGSDNVTELNVSNLNTTSRLQSGVSVAAEDGSFTKDDGQATRSVIYTGVSRANYSLSAAYFDIGPEYDPLNAYVAQPDIRGPIVSGSLTSTTNARAAVRQYSVSAYADRYVDESGAAREVDTGDTVGVTFKNLLNLSIGQNLSSLRTYAVAYPTYQGGVTYPYDQTTLAASFRSGTPNTESISFSRGPYATYFLQQLDTSLTHAIARNVSAEFDYDTVDERFDLEAANGQTLRRLTLLDAISADQSLGIAYRTINGTGGFASPGHNLALSYHRQFGNGSTLFVEYGSPAAASTLQRTIVKYVLLVGPGAGE